MVDLSSGFVVWKYNGIGDTEFADHRNAGLLGMASDDIASIQRVPDPEAIRASSGDLTDKIVLRPGDALHINLEIRDDLQADRSVLLENLSGAVQQAGYRIDDSAAATLSVEMGRSKTTDESYIVIGPSNSGGNQFTVRYSGYYTKGEIRKDNETIWKVSLGTGMGKPSYKPRKEPYDYVEQPHKNTLKTFPLPQRVFAAKYESGFGSSRITPRGIE